MTRHRFRLFQVLIAAIAGSALAVPAAGNAQTETAITPGPAVDRAEWDAATARIRDARYSATPADLIVLGETALAVAERSFGPQSPEALSMGHFLGDLYLANGRAADAVPLFARALAAARPFLGDDSFDTWNIVASLAAAYHQLGRFADADPLFERALADSRGLMNAQHPQSLIALQLLVRNRLRDPALAGRAVAPARELADEIRRRRDTMAEPGLVFAQRLGDLGNRSYDVCDEFGLARTRERQDKSNDLDAFALAAEASWFAPTRATRGTQDEAFAALQELTGRPAGTAVERRAARELAEARVPGLGAAVRRSQTVDDLLAANAKDQARQICNFGGESQTAEQFLARAQMDARLDGDKERLTAEAATLDRQIREAFPEYRYANLPLTIAETQRQLAGDEAVLILSPTRYGVQSMAISKTGVAWSRADWTPDQLTAAVQRLLWDARADVRVDPATEARWLDESGGGYNYDRRTAFAVYDAIVAPVEPVLADKPKLFVAAGGMLSSLPLGILVTRPPTGRDGDPAALRATAWYADAHAIAAVPSLSSWLHLRAAAPDRGPPIVGPATGFAGYGDPVLLGAPGPRGARASTRGPDTDIFRGGASEAGSGIADVVRIRQLPRLPGTRTELEDMRAALDAPVSAVHLQSDATEAAVRGADLSAVRILAFATHGLLAGQLGGNAEPGLILTPPEQPSDADDGFLAASEIVGLSLDADWVILSACNTAGGDGSAGAPGLSGLARAFFYAGSRSLLVSHWPVFDDVAARLTVDAIRRRAGDPRLSRAQALQAAMRAIRLDPAHDDAGASWAHPAAWAPFSLISGGSD